MIPVDHPTHHTQNDKSVEQPDVYFIIIYNLAARLSDFEALTVNDAQ